MTTRTSKSSRIRRIAAISLGVIVVILIIAILSGPKVGAALHSLTAPRLPQLVEVEKRVWLNQGWSPEVADKYHYITQGSDAFLVPFGWMLALEQPAPSLFAMPFGRRGGFLDDDYFLRFGFIKGEVSENNPHGLAVGLTPVEFQTLFGLSQQQTGLGLTCAGCHTARLRYENTEYLIDGGPASTDLAQVTQALGAALGQTLVSSKFPAIIGRRFDRFAHKVLGVDGYNDANVVRLKEDLSSAVAALQKMPINVDVVEGFARVDALNRIGNALFGIYAGRLHNYAPPDAPVNYPHIWTSPWFDWVQYDASIMGPLIRNAGEALGLGGYVNLTADISQQRFSSSIPLENLSWIESVLSGVKPPFPSNREFGGLQAPAWPAEFPEIDKARAERGSDLYQLYCKGCHLQPLDSPAIWSDEYFSQVTYYVNGEERKTRDALLRLNVIPLDEIGTDPGQSSALAKRSVDTSGDVTKEDPHLSQRMGVEADVCTWSAAAPPTKSYDLQADSADKLESVSVKDGPMLNFGLALGAIVQKVVEQSFDANNIPESQWELWQEDRPNCLQLGKGYKARPLNGVWATAPFLHNGSIPTLMDLLSPPEERPAFVVLGDVEFDVENVGIKQDRKAKFNPKQKYNRDRFFVLDTSIPGNSNRGHEFSADWDGSKPYNKQRKGVIGPELGLQQRADLIEYLKTL